MFKFDENREERGILSIPELNINDVEASFLFNKGEVIIISFWVKESISLAAFDKISQIEALNFRYSFLFGGIRWKGEICDAIKGFQYKLAAQWAVINPTVLQKNGIVKKDWTTFSIKRIAVSTSNLKEWLFPSLPVNYPEKIQFIKNCPSKIELFCTYLSRQVHIYDTYEVYSKMPNAQTYILDVIPYINIETKGTSFTVKDLLEICANLNWFFSVLMGNISLTRIVRLNTYDYFYQVGYFDNKSLSSPAYFLLPSKILFGEKLFPKIFKEFALNKDSLFKRYPHLWTLIKKEIKNPAYEDFLCLFTMLDNVISEKFDLPPLSSPNIDLKNIADELKNKLHSLLSPSEQKSKEGKILLDNIIQSFLSGNRWTYRQKLQYVWENKLPKSLQQVIDLNPEMLNLIVDARNKFAHADKLPKKFNPHAWSLFYKTLLLVYVFAWLDLGLDAQTIILALYRHFGPLHEVCNRKSLDLYFGMKEIHLLPGEFDKFLAIPSGTSYFSNQPVYDSIVLECIEGEYNVNIEKTKLFREKMVLPLQTPSRKFTDVLQSLYKDPRDISYQNAWLTDGKRSERVSIIMIVK